MLTIEDGYIVKTQEIRENNGDGTMIAYLEITKYKVNKEGLLEEVIDKPVEETYTPIETIWFSPRTLNALIMANLFTVEQVQKLSKKELWKFKWMWKAAMKEIEKVIDNNNQLWK